MIIVLSETISIESNFKIISDLKGFSSNNLTINFENVKYIDFAGASLLSLIIYTFSHYKRINNIIFHFGNNFIIGLVLSDLNFFSVLKECGVSDFQNKYVGGTRHRVDSGIILVKINYHEINEEIFSEALLYELRYVFERIKGNFNSYNENYANFIINSLSIVFTELGDNALYHAKSSFATIGFHANRNYVGFTISDLGIGIKSSLKKSTVEEISKLGNKLNDFDCIDWALREKNSSTGLLGRGYGLSTIRELTVNDYFAIYSGSALVRFNNNKIDNVIIDHYKGTIVTLKFFHR